MERTWSHDVVDSATRMKYGKSCGDVYSLYSSFSLNWQLLSGRKTKMKTLKQIKEWVKQLKEDMEKESVSQMKGTPHCCSRPIEPVTRKGK
jgi:hypothetical protein